MGKYISLYGSHDSSLCFNPSPNEFRIYEFERFLKKRYCSLNEESDSTFIDAITYVKNLIDQEYGKQEYESLFYGQLSSERLQMVMNIFGFTHVEEMSHHLSHAAGALYQSSFDKALIISHDSGGHEMQDGIQTFCIFVGDKSQPFNHVVQRLANIPLDAAGGYTMTAVPLAEIYKTDVYSRYLSYAGKLMGLCAYGNIHHEWIEAFAAYYYRPVNIESLERLGKEISLDFSTINTISGQTSYDVAATSQYVFQQVVINAILPFVERYQLPIILTGGGALNVLLNEKLRTLPYPVFVPVNPNDCGLSFGMMCLRNPPTQTVNVSYSGFGILDINKLPDYAEKFKARPIHIRELARILCAGKIVGVMRGNSECGPRALGNRSILAWPGEGIKDKINNQIKFREEWRPLAPVVRLEDAKMYFSPACVSPFMSYSPWVDVPYRNKIPAVVHKDTTARVQTVTEEQNEFLYALLTCVEVIKDIGILLNTSFNIKGKPILTTIEDAIEVWQTTDLDCLFIEGHLFEK